MPQVDIKLVSTADTGGFDKASQATKALTSEIGGAGQSSKQAAKGVNELGENFEKGAGAGRIMGEAMKGNVSAMLQLAPAIKAVGAMMKTSLIGILITIGALAAQVLVPLIKGFADAKKELEAMGKAADEAKLHLQGLDKTKMDSLKQQLEGITKSTTDALEEFKLLASEMDKIASAKFSADMAGIDASNLSPEEKEKKKAALQATEDERKRQLPVAQQLEEYQLLSIDAGRKRAVAEEAATKYADITDAIGVSQFAALPKLLEEKRGLEKAQALAELGRAPGSPDMSEEETARKKRIAEIATQLTREDPATYKTEAAYKAEMERRQKLQDDVDAQFSSATQADQAAQDKAARAGRNYFSSVRVAGAQKDSAQRIAGYAAQKSAMSPDEQAKRIEELQATAEKAAQSGDWAAQDKAVAAAKAKADWSKKYGTGAAPANATPFSAYKPNVKTTTYAPDGTPDGKADLAQPLTEAAKAHEDAAKQSGESTQAAAEAAEKLKESAKPLDAAPLTTALQAAATAQQTAGAQSVAAIQSLTTTAGQLTQIAQQQSRQIETLRSQVAQVAQQVTNLRAAQNAA